MNPLVRTTFNWFQRQFTSQRIVSGTEATVEALRTKARPQAPQTRRATTTGFKESALPGSVAHEYEVLHRLVRDLEESLPEAKGSRSVIRASVATPAGMAKLVTPFEVIEIAPVYTWQEALAHIERVKNEFPTLRSRLHLYGRIRPAWLRCIRAKCAARGVLVSHDAFSKINLD